VAIHNSLFYEVSCKKKIHWYHTTIYEKAITGNHENIIISDNEDIVLPYLSEFETLWKEFDPNKT
jgi:hypothetical protein